MKNLGDITNNTTRAEHGEEKAEEDNKPHHLQIEQENQAKRYRHYMAHIAIAKIKTTRGLS